MTELAQRVRAAQLPSPAARIATRRAAGVSLSDGAHELHVTAGTIMRWVTRFSGPRLERAIEYRRLVTELRAAVA